LLAASGLTAGSSATPLLQPAAGEAKLAGPGYKVEVMVIVAKM
jgi:hypothetical protein